MEKLLPNNIFFVPKLNSIKTQFLHRIRPQKYNPEKPPEDSHQEARRQIDDNIIIPHDDDNIIITHVGRNLFDILINYIVPDDSDFDEGHKQGSVSVNVLRTYIVTPTMVKTPKLAPFLTHLRYIFQIINRMVIVKTLRSLQIYAKFIAQNKHLSQTRKLKMHINLCSIHHRGRVTPVDDWN